MHDSYIKFFKNVSRGLMDISTITFYKFWRYLADWGVFFTNSVEGDVTEMKVHRPMFSNNYLLHFNVT
jgi:hypothetical protein